MAHRSSRHRRACPVHPVPRKRAPGGAYRLTRAWAMLFTDGYQHDSADGKEPAGYKGIFGAKSKYAGDH